MESINFKILKNCMEGDIVTKCDNCKLRSEYNCQKKLLEYLYKKLKENMDNENN